MEHVKKKVDSIALRCYTVYKLNKRANNMTLKLAYCDYIAARLHTLIDRELNDNQTMIESVTHPKMDLHPTEGYRGVGYVFEQEVFDEAVHSISATKSRKELREKGDLDK